MQATAYSNQGKRREALHILETDVRLEPEDFKDKQRLVTKLHQRLKRVNKSTSAFYLMTLAGLLGAEGRRDDGVAVMEADAHLEPGDYKDDKGLADKLAMRLQGFDKISSFIYLQGLGGTLAMAGRHMDALRVSEVYAGLESADYEHPSQLSAKLHKLLDNLPPEIAVTYIMSLAGALGIAGRDSESVIVLRTYLGLEGTDESDVIKLTSAMKTQIQQLPTEAAIALLHMSLSYANGRPEEIALWEAITGLEPADYHKKQLLSDKLHTMLSTISPDVAAMYITTLAGFLNFGDRVSDALALIEADSGLEESDYQDATRIVSRLRNRFAPLAEESSSTYLRIFVGTLSNLGHHEQAVMVQEVDAGLEQIDYTNFADLSNRVKQRLQRLTEGTAAAYLLELVYTLDTAGKQTKAALLIDCYMRVLLNLHGRPEDEHSPVLHVCTLVNYWFQYFGRAEQERTFSICGQIVPYLRRNLAQRGVTLKDRADFIEMVSSLRRHIVESGYYWASKEQDEDQARQLWLVTQLWDTELSQRLLWERFLLSQLDNSIAPDIPPGITWPCVQQRPHTHSLFPTENRGRVLSDEQVSFLEETGGDSQIVEEPKQVHLTPDERESALKATYPDLFERGTAIVQQGIDETLLAHSLGPHSVLLRATFDSWGRLLWVAMTSDGSKLTVASYGSGSVGDQERIRWIVAMHDLRCQVVRLSLLHPQVQEEVYYHLKSSLENLLGYFDWVQQSDAKADDITKPNGQQLFGVIQQMVDTVFTMNQHFTLGLLETCVTPMLQAPDDSEEFVSWAVEAARRVKEFQTILAAEPPVFVNLQDILNTATRQCVEEIAEVWNLDMLTTVLIPQMDMILQLDDTLHALPLAHLLVAGRPLYQQVRSMRTSISLLLTLLQQEAEQKFWTGRVENRQLLVVSWFEEGDHSREVVKWLHHGHLTLAETYGMTCYAAADDPPGTLGAISAALASGKTFHVMTICGHGNRHRMGIKLRNEQLWDGGGCDLSKVGWLLMVSCSIGRLAQSGDRDVEGFCVRLALHRALSVLACRWAVNSLEACVFANKVVRRYLHFHEELDKQRMTDSECLRARALNDARKYFLDNDPQELPHPSVGLNTIAAFDLYGIG